MIVHVKGDFVWREEASLSKYYFHYYDVTKASSKSFSENSIFRDMSKRVA